MRFKFRMPADENEVFAHDAFEDQVGQLITFEPFGQGRIIDIIVSEDGKTALITVEKE